MVFVKLALSYEQADDVFVAIDIDHHGKYGGVYDNHRSLEDSEKLSYETCEMRIPGSFDDTPPEDEEAI